MGRKLQCVSYLLGRVLQEGNGSMREGGVSGEGGTYAYNKEE